MKNLLLVVGLLLIGVVTLSACTASILGFLPVNREINGDVDPVVTEDVLDVVPNGEEIAIPADDFVGQNPTENTDEQDLSFAAADYLEESAGILIRYPEGWGISPREQIGERGAQAGLLSPGSTLEEIAEGGSRIIITTYTWDPKNDLAAYVDQRRLAWDASGFEILSEESLSLTNGRIVEVFRIKTGEGGEVIFALTNAGEDYLQVFGDGDLDLCTEIIRSMEPVE